MGSPGAAVAAATKVRAAACLADAASVLPAPPDGLWLVTSIAIEIVRKPARQVGFCVHKRRWVVERCFAWPGRNRRLAKDFEATLASAIAFVYAASVLLRVRRNARSA